jgi:hypothetical protein
MKNPVPIKICVLDHATDQKQVIIMMKTPTRNPSHQ